MLVGDDYQLPPIIISSEAQARGMDVSLLKRLIEAHPEAATCLTAQYRMNEQIMTLCNTLIYENRMTCATSSVASARLILNSFPPSRCGSDGGRVPKDYKSMTRSEIAHINDSNDSSCVMSSNIWGSATTTQQCLGSDDSWLLHCLNPEHSVVFLNTDSMHTHQLSAPEGGAVSILREGPFSSGPLSDPNNSGFRPDLKGTNVHVAEVTVVCRIVQGLERCGFNVRKGGGLGVISPFRSQVAAIKEALSVLTSKENALVTAAAPSSGSATNRSSCGSYPPTVGLEGRASRVAVTETAGARMSSKGCDEAESECEVSTVDSFQGRDMDAVIFSTMKNIQEGSVSDVLYQHQIISHDALYGVTLSYLLLSFSLILCTLLHAPPPPPPLPPHPPPPPL